QLQRRQLYGDTAGGRDRAGRLFLVVVATRTVSQRHLRPGTRRRLRGYLDRRLRHGDPVVEQCCCQHGVERSLRLGVHVSVYLSPVVAVLSADGSVVERSPAVLLLARVDAPLQLVLL